MTSCSSCEVLDGVEVDAAALGPRVVGGPANGQEEDVVDEVLDVVDELDDAVDRLVEEGALVKRCSFFSVWPFFLQLAVVVPQLRPIPQSSMSRADCSFSNTSKRFFTLVVGMKSAKVAALGMGRPCLGATVCHSTAPMKVGALAGQVTAFTGRVAPAPPSLQCRDMCPGLPQR